LTDEPVWFAVLGPLEVRRAGTELDLGRPQERALLALLLVRAGQPVALSEIIDVLWGHRPPDSAINVVRRHVGTLRRLLEPGLAARAAGRWLVRSSGGYRLVVDEDSLDLLRFRVVRDQARRVAASGDSAARAVGLFSEALALWRGPAGSGIPDGVRAHAMFRSLDQERLATVKDAADAALRAGVPEAVLTELQEAAVGHPLDEPLLARLVLTLSAAGRRPEALGTYRAAVSRLADELGIDPGPELRDAHRAVRDEPPSPTPGASGAPDRAGPGPSVPAPAQLPHDLPTFTGRRSELDQVLRLSESGTGPVGPVVISAIGGMAGIGKTTLAVHWAHRIADRFPDGQLYVDLRGFDPSGAVMSPGEAVRGFLDTLGVPPEQVPYGLDAQAALYRSLLAGRRFLVLLDNARDTDHVRPLLPGTPDCLTIVTSRNQLSGLVAAHGAHALTLRPLDPGQARELLARRLGAERVAAEPRAVAEITALCSGLPLALACVAARAAAHPHFPLSAIAAELLEDHGSLDSFTRADVSADVSAVFSWSSRAVSPGAARLFRLLSLHPGPDFSAPAAGALAGLPVREARLLLTELSGVHLLNEHVPGRYAFHDLLRAHAADLVRAEHPEAERQEAVRRLFEHYLHTAHAAGLLIAPHADPLPLAPPAPGTAPEPLPDDRRALSWLTAEYPVLLTVIEAAANSGADAETEAETEAASGAAPGSAAGSGLGSGSAGGGNEYDSASGPGSGASAGSSPSSGSGGRGRGNDSGNGNGNDNDNDSGSGSDSSPSSANGADSGPGSDGHSRSSSDGHSGPNSDGALASRPLPCLLACLLAWSLEPFFDRRGHWHDWTAAQRTALVVALRSGDPGMEARALRGLGRAEGRLGLHGEARAHLGRALELFAALGDDIGRANTHRSLGWEAEQGDDLPGALRHNQLALNLFRATGQRAAQASVLNSVGWYHALLGEYRQALGNCFEALTMLQDLGDRYGQAATWDSIAYAHHHLGRHPHALVGYRNALALYEELGVPYMEAATLTRIAETHHAMGDHAAARTAWHRALTMFTALGHPDADQVRIRMRGGHETRDLA